MESSLAPNRRRKGKVYWLARPKLEAGARVGALAGPQQAEEREGVLVQEVAVVLPIRRHTKRIYNEDNGSTCGFHTPDLGSPSPNCVVAPTRFKVVVKARDTRARHRFSNPHLWFGGSSWGSPRPHCTVVWIH